MVKAKKLPSGAWNVMVFSHIEDGKRKYKSITRPTKAEVEYAAAEFKREKKQNKGHKVEHTVSQAISDYINLSEVLSPTTLQSYTKIQEFAFPGLMDMDVDSLRDIDVQQAINKECKRKSYRTGKPISPKTVKNEWALVASALKTVCNKSFNIRLPKIARHNEDLPEPEDIMAAIVGTKVELPCLLAMWCGLRLSEIRGITYDSIKKNVLDINKVVVDVDGKATTKVLGKTDLSLRKVLLPSYILDLIKAQGKNESGFVVDMTRNEIYHYFKRVTERNGIDISFHDLRHVYASVMLTKLQVPQRVVQESGGWSTPDVMLKVYSQSFSDNRLEADRLRDEYFEKCKMTMQDKSS